MTISTILRPLSHRPPCSAVCPTQQEGSCQTSPRPPSCQWLAASWEWPVPSTVAAVEAAAPVAAIDCSMRAIVRYTTSQVLCLFIFISTISNGKMMLRLIKTAQHLLVGIWHKACRVTYLNLDYVIHSNNIYRSKYWRFCFYKCLNHLMLWWSKV